MPCTCNCSSLAGFTDRLREEAIERRVLKNYKHSVATTWNSSKCVDVENSLSPHFFPSVWRQEDRLTATLYHRRGKVGLVEPTHARKHGLSEGSQGDQWARFKTAAAAFYTRAGTRGERKKNPSNNFHPRSRESSLTADAAAMMGCQPHCSWTSLHVTTSCSWGCRIFISSACLKFFLFFVCFRPA